MTGLGAGAAWVWSAWHQAVTLRRQQDQREWTRIQELITLIGNERGTIGTWEQIAAVMELGALKSKRHYVVAVLSRLRPFYVHRNASKELIAAIDEVI